jgi:hypothetical protein
MLPGDTIKLNGSVIEQRRGASVVATRTYIPPGPSFEPGTTPVKRTISEVYFFEEIKMPGQIVTLLSVNKNNNTGVINFNFSNGSSLEFNSFQALENAVKYLDTEPETCQHALCLKTIRNSPDGANLENMVGASMSADFTAAVPFNLVEG